MGALKDKIQAYWARRAATFMAQRLRELSSEKRALWRKELETYLPDGKRLRILDIGTGTGFFAFLLAAEGHTVTGIDLTEDMIRRARAGAKKLGLRPRFLVMDAESPEFAPESFDAIVTRNLTWTLPHLAQAYKKWRGLLAPGGVLINFDADYCHAFNQADDMEHLAIHAHKEIPKALMAENDAITQELCAYQDSRPEWDVRLLLDAGFSRVAVDAGVWERIYAAVDEFYNPVPIFTISARR